MPIKNQVKVADAKNLEQSVFKKVIGYVNNPYVQLAFMVGSFLVDRKRAREAKKRAERERRDARVLTISNRVLSDAGKKIPYRVGRSLNDGLIGYAQTGKDLPNPLPTSNVFGSLKVDPDRQTDRQEFGLVQYISTLGKVNTTYSIFMDGKTIGSGNNNSLGVPVPSPVVGYAIAQMNVGGTANDMSARFTEERDDQSKWTPVSYASVLFHNDTGNPDSYQLQSFPQFSDYTLSNAPRKLQGNPVKRVADVDVRCPSTLVLAEAWTDPHLLGKSLDSLALEELENEANEDLQVMQGKDGLSAQAYPARHNAINGTNFATYADAFKHYKFESWADSRFRLTRERTTAAGYESGLDPQSAYVGNKYDDPDWRIFRSQCNGVIPSTPNPADIIAAIMSAKSGAALFRRLSDGKYTVRSVRTNRTPAQLTVAFLNESDIVSLEENTESEQIDSVTGSYQNIHTASESSLHFPLQGSHAAAVLKPSVGKPNNSQEPLPLANNRYHAMQSLVHEVLTSRLRSWRMRVMPSARRFEPNDVLDTTYSPLNLTNQKMLVWAAASTVDGAQNLIVAEFDQDIYKWWLTYREGEEPERYVEEPIPPPPQPCITIVGRTIHFDLWCERDPETGLPVDPQPIRLPPIPDEESLSGDNILIDLPPPTGEGAENETVSVTGLPDGLTFDPESRRIQGIVDVATDTDYEVTETVDGTDVEETFTITVLALKPGRIHYLVKDASYNDLYDSGDYSIIHRDRIATEIPLEMEVRGRTKEKELVKWKYETTNQSVMLTDPEGTILSVDVEGPNPNPMDSTPVFESRYIQGTTTGRDIGTRINVRVPETGAAQEYTVSGSMTALDDSETLSRDIKIKMEGI